MAHALLLHLVVTGTLAVVLSGLISAQWLLARLADHTRTRRGGGQPPAAAPAASSAVP